ncbi:tetratricopeptide repeat-containing glycosyltransferase family 2 protein [Paenibacillus azoreducens]|uniref:Glycosyltransferase 2-like domain-containing protein n=1 Tax=Paenibacillus azoreducens TaxID=116718 RepID=A0A919YC05_9BACL|nr:glycosyltransferase [Paenibacillus azoreducens]GIO46383.1 hypothetical protein J34TS1_11480 [Paenibacillus azoreducens]
MNRITNGISLCMIVRNEADHLPRCLQSVRRAVDEIIVVDTGSTDESIAIARRFGARVIRTPWEGDFSKARNAGLELARGTWILFMDADEELDRGDIAELRLCARHMEYEGFFLQVLNHSGNDIRSATATVNPLLRMFRRRPEHRFRGKIHEQIAASITEHRPTAKLHITNIKIHHYGYSSAMVAAKDKIRRNADLLQQALQAEPNDPFNHYNMAVEYMRMNDNASALRHIRQAKNLAAPEISYYHLLFKYEARCLLSMGRIDEALDICQSGLDHFPDYTDLLHLKGVILLSSGQASEAEKAFHKAVEAGPAPVHYHTESGAGTYLSTLGLGQIREDAGDDAGALHWYAQTLKHEPGMRPPFHKIIRIMKSNLQDKLIPSFICEHLQPESSETVNSIAGLLMANRCYEAAGELLERFRHIASSPENEKLRFISKLLSEGREFRQNVGMGTVNPSTKIHIPSDESDTWSDSLQIELAYYAGDTEKALEAVYGMIAPLPSPPSALHAERKSTTARLLAAFAETHLLQLLHHHPGHAVIRKAVRLLPPFEYYE